jgi:ABC-type oligopeptide transport system substrate-binding subunit/class 3 adenylate cyclase
MRCSKCQSENPRNANFCLSCGAPLGDKTSRACPQCGKEIPADAKFCPSCGAEVDTAGRPVQENRLQSLQQAAPKGLRDKVQQASLRTEGERKPVTILFADIVGSTTLAEKLDPEEWKEIVNGVHRRVVEAIYRYEGTVAQLLGDGVLAFFGAPVTHEDDPIRGVMAGLDIQSSIRDYSRSLEGYLDEMQMRVGINTGEVVIGNVGTDMHVEYLAIGDAVNIAARLQSAAEPGSVLISSASARMIGDDFALVDMGEIVLKGKTDSIQVFEVQQARRIPTLRRGIEPQAAPYIGRTHEVEKVEACLRALCAGQGGIVALLGEAGIGKSRLLEEVRAHIARDDESLDGVSMPLSSIRWLEGRALSYGGSLPYWVITQLLLDDLGLSDGAPEVKIKVALRKRLAELHVEAESTSFTYLARLLGMPIEKELDDQGQSFDAETVKRETLAALKDYFWQVAKSQPTVLILEDLHWADPSSMEVLSEIMSLTDRVPLLLILLMRVEREHGSWRLKQLAETEYPHRCTEMTLSRLSDDQADQLMNHLLGEGEFPEQIKELVRTRSEGNPFYLEEVIYHLVDNGLIERVGGEWHVNDAIVVVGIPETLQGVLLARIDRLEEDVRRTLQIASVIGRSFLFSLLEAISEAEQELDEHLSKLQRMDLVREKTRLPELEYIFKHTLTQEAAYNSLLLGRRKEFHLKVGEAIETLFPGRREEFLGLLAHHYEAAGALEKARDYLLRAGDQARLAYANEEAIEFYHRVLPVLRELGEDETAVKVLMKLGLTCHSAFQFDAAREAYDQAFTRGRELGKIKARPSEPPSADPLRFELSDIPTLDPTLAPDSTSGLIINQLFRGLLKVDLDLNVCPDIASSWDVLEDGKKYVFHLREDVFWSDGERVKASDFKFAWMNILDPDNQSPLDIYLHDIRNAQAYHVGEITDPDRVGVQAADEQTLVVTLEGPCSYIMYLLTIPGSFPIPEHVVRHDPRGWAEPERIVGNGPFLLESLQPGNALILQRNPKYYGDVLGNVQRIEVKLDLDVTAPGKSIERYEKNETDILYLPPLVMSEAKTKCRTFAEDLISVPDLMTAYIGFNVRCPPFDDRRIRIAFAMALDKSFIADVLMDGVGFPATGGFIPLGLPGHSDNIGIPFSPDRARELFKEAGYLTGSDFPFVEAFAGSAAARKMTEYAQAQWQDILGVEIRWSEPGWPQFLKRMHESPPNVFGMSWMADYPDPDNFLRTGSWPTETGWRNEQFEALVMEARRVPDPVKRSSMYRQAEKILMGDAPIVPLLYGRSHYLFKPWVTASPFFSSGSVPNLEDFIIHPH